MLKFRRPELPFKLGFSSWDSRRGGQRTEREREREGAQGSHVKKKEGKCWGRGADSGRRPPCILFLSCAVFSPSCGLLIDFWVLRLDNNFFVSFVLFFFLPVAASLIRGVCG